jgi:hypothetical protein
MSMLGSTRSIDLELLRKLDAQWEYFLAPVLAAVAFITVRFSTERE